MEPVFQKTSVAKNYKTLRTKGTKAEGECHTPISALKCEIVKNGVFPVGFVLFLLEIQDGTDVYGGLRWDGTRR
jgi:hypothetical protein